MKIIKRGNWLYPDATGWADHGAKPSCLPWACRKKHPIWGHGWLVEYYAPREGTRLRFREGVTVRTEKEAKELVMTKAIIERLTAR